MFEAKRQRSWLIGSEAKWFIKEAAMMIFVTILTRWAAAMLQLWSSRTADMLMAAIGEAQERSTRRGLLVYRAWLSGSRHPRGT